MKAHGAAVPDRQYDGAIRKAIADDESGAPISLLEKLESERLALSGGAHAEYRERHGHRGNDKRSG